jgi:hypothetical protein
VGRWEWEGGAVTATIGSTRPGPLAPKTDGDPAGRRIEDRPSRAVAAPHGPHAARARDAGAGPA